jgi:hypothetical protein
MKKILLATLLVSTLGIGLVSCGGTTTSIDSVSDSTTSETTSEEEKTLESIELSGSYQTEYTVGESFKKTGLVVTAKYSDGTSTQVYDYRISGFDSETTGEKVVTVTWGEKTATFTVTVNEAPLVYVDVTFKLTVSGIDTYEGDHAKIYMCSSLFLKEDGGWDTKELTQDSENPNLWTITVEDVLAGQSYDYSYYYGSDTTPNWSKGKNVIDSENISVLIEEDTELVEDNLSFTVPTIAGSVDVDLAIDAQVKTSAEADAVGLNEGVYVYAWEETTGQTLRFEKGEDGLWHHTYTISLEESTGLGTLHFTPVLGLEGAADWSYPFGAYNDSGVFEAWNSTGYTFNDIDEDTTTKVFTATFAGQPKPVDENNAYTVTFKLYVAEGSLATGYGLNVGDVTAEWTSGVTTWVDSL